MTEMLLNTNTLPEPLFRLIRTEKVKVIEVDGIIQLMPITETDDICPLRGIANSSNLTVDRFLAMKEDKKRLEL